MNKKDGLTSIDLFAGAGGLGLGLEWAGFNVVAANEFDSVFASTYAANHPNTTVIPGDILDSQVRWKLLKVGRGVDLVAGGPPCQGFSTVGKKNERDPRNKLFYAFLEVVEALNPRAVLFENVSGFKRMYGGRAYFALDRELVGLGYRTTHAILNASSYGVPQQRERTFVIGMRAPNQFKFPEPEFGDTETLFGTKTLVTLQDALSDLPPVESGESKHSYASKPKNDYQRLMRAESKSELHDHEGPNHGDWLMRVMRRVPTGGSVLDLPKNMRPKSYFANTYARLWWDRPSTTITRNLGTPSSSRCIHPKHNRGLTTREGARLQSFPDSYRFHGTRIKRNLQIGNAVPPLLAKVIGESLRDALLNVRVARKKSA